MAAALKNPVPCRCGREGEFLYAASMLNDQLVLVGYVRHAPPPMETTPGGHTVRIGVPACVVGVWHDEPVPKGFAANGR